MDHIQPIEFVLEHGELVFWMFFGGFFELFSLKEALISEGLEYITRNLFASFPLSNNII